MTRAIVFVTAEFLVVSSPVLAVALLSVAFHRSWTKRDSIFKVAVLLALVLTLLRVAARTSIEPSDVGAFHPGTIALTTDRLSFTGISLIDVAAILLLSASTTSLLIAIARAVRFRYRVRDRAALTDERWTESLRGFYQGSVRLTMTRGATSPFSLGREICIPRWMVGALDDAERRATLAHEIDHLRRRDHWWALLLDSCCVMFCVQPLLFVVRRQMAALAEQRADRAAARAVGSGVPLAEVLYKVAQRLVAAEAVHSFALLRRNDAVVARVEQLLARRPARTACAGLVIAGHFTLAGTIACAVAMTVPSLGLAKRSSPVVSARPVSALRAPSESAADALATILRTDPSPHVRYAAAEALGRRRERSAADALERAARYDSDSNVRVAAATALETVSR